MIQPLVVAAAKVQLVVRTIARLQMHMHMGVLGVLMHRGQRPRLREGPLQVLLRQHPGLFRLHLVLE
jgi:hypothetical protein